ncbi:DNA replication endonuclease-helicase Dna2 [Taxawa tesnikishii (nom. ined.)]|nr:DNA replication endonuclease-helicase Dna2 [Dothideales sp. JES 119]
MSINRFTYTLIKKEPAPGFSFTESQITLGEPIVISSEKGHFALANGYITRVSARRISVAVDRRLHNARRKQAGFNSQTSQVFTGIMEVGKEDHQEEIVAATDSVKEEETVYRLDKDEFSNGMATVRNNLLAIMDDCVYRSYELRRLIVENCAPAFKPSPTAYTLSGPASQLQVNADQRAAIDKVMSAQDYALVLGMPGTGKTTTIAHIIRALVANGKSVLLTSYTHTAVDNILLKLREDNISILRLGVLAKIHPEVQAFAGLAAVPKTSIEELEDTYMRPQVVATTCLGITHQLFQRRVFDYCIVDEASQITLPVCLGPIRMARTFVLVGDHYQLPPLVQNREAQEGGLDVSLFKLLSDRQPESVVNLEHQYRMCEDVMLLSNTLIYSGRLKCGNDAVAKRVLRVPDPEGLQRLHVAMPSSHPQLVSTLSNACSSARDATCWLSTLLTPARRVVFANTDTLSPAARETLSGSRITNAVEVTLTTTLVLGLLAQGVPARDIGVITFYRSQLALLRAALKTPTLTPAEPAPPPPARWSCTRPISFKDGTRKSSSCRACAVTRRGTWATCSRTGGA